MVAPLHGAFQKRKIVRPKWTAKERHMKEETVMRSLDATFGGKTPKKKFEPLSLVYYARL